MGNVDVNAVLSPAILVALADDTLRGFVIKNLREECYSVIAASDGMMALHLAQQGPLLLAILDLKLPEYDGIALCHLLRTQKTTAFLPILLLAMVDDEIAPIVGLEVGADDYVTWPLNWKILRARIRALLRRSRYLSDHEAPALEETGEREQILLIADGKVRINVPGREVLLRDQPVELSARLFDLLVYLVRHQAMVFSRKELQIQVLGKRSESDERLVDIYIHRLREKLEDEPTRPRHIQTVRGIGYRFMG